MSEVVSPSGWVGTTLARFTAAEATGTFGLMDRANITTIADKIRYLDDATGLLNFPATQVASAGANVLDDYEEGTFTPGITFGGGSTGITYTTQSGNYVKVGQIVHATLRLQLSSKGSSTGAVAIGNLPFVASSAVPSFSITGDIYYANMSGLTDGLIAFLAAAGTSLSVFQGGATGTATIADTNCSATTDLIVSITYRASA